MGIQRFQERFSCGLSKFNYRLDLAQSESESEGVKIWSENLTWASNTSLHTLQ